MIESVIADPSAHEQFLWRNDALETWESSMVHVTAVGHSSVASVFGGIKAYWNAEHQQLTICNWSAAKAVFIMNG
jgi:branched-chain amino acid aminotransferase